jgi:hypothetical protein
VVKRFGCETVVQVLYVAGSSASGTTLLAFLLNTHPAIFTVSHTVGYPFEARDGFRCSCGAFLPDCPFFSHVAKAFRDRRLPFAYNAFGTRHRVVANERLNRWLTGALPLVQSNALEKIRDAVVRRIPGVGTTLHRQDEANRTFIQVALAYRGAAVYADTSQDPHRLRHLERIRELHLSVIHLIRDPRGIAVSHRDRHGITPEIAARKWLIDQWTVMRVLKDFTPSMTLLYEDLCDRPGETMTAIHRFVGLPAHPLPDDFKSAEHHILGNVMRERTAEIARDNRWRTELSPADLAAMTRTLRSFVERHARHPLAAIVQRYLQDH